MSDDAAPIHDSIELDAPAPSSPTTPHGTTERPLDSELDQQYLEQAGEQVAAVDHGLGLTTDPDVAALDSLTVQPDPGQPTQAPVTQAPVTQAPVTQAPVTQAPVTQAPVTQTPTTPILAAEAQFATENPSVVAQIEQVEASETKAIADAPGLAAEIEGQAIQEVLGDVAKVDPELASKLESELDATAEQLDPAALSAEELRIEEQLTAPAPEHPSAAT